MRIRRVFASSRTHIIAAKIYVSPLNLCYKLRQLYVYYVRNNRLLLLPTANCQQPAGNWQLATGNAANRPTRGQPTTCNHWLVPVSSTRYPSTSLAHPLSTVPSVRPTPLGAIKRGIIFAHNCINNALFSVDFIQQSVCVCLCVCG